MKKYLILGCVLLLALIVWIVIGGRSDSNNTIAEPPMPAENIFPEGNSLGENVSERDKSIIINEKFNDLQSATIDRGTWVPMIYYYEPANSITLREGAESLGVNITAQLYPLLSQDTWDVNRCVANDGSSALALRMHVRLLPDYSGNLYMDLQRILQNWQQSMLDDVSEVLFRDSIADGVIPVATGEFTEQNLGYPDPIYSVPVIVEGGISELSYVLSGDDIVISNDTSCVVRIAYDLIASD